MNRLDYYRAVLLGSVMGMSIITLFHMVFNVALDVKEPEAPKSNFEFVDTYKSCDVVRYTDETQRWNYFLDCSDK